MARKNKTDDKLRCIYLCPFPGLGGTQEYTYMLARKMAGLNPTTLIMPFDQPQEIQFGKPFRHFGGETLALPPDIYLPLNGRSYIGRFKAGMRLRRFIREHIPVPAGHRLVVHGSLSPLALASLALFTSRHWIIINVFHDFGSLTHRSISFFPNTVALNILSPRRCAYVVPSRHIERDLSLKVAALPPTRVHVIHNGIDPLPARATYTPTPPLKFGMIGRVAEAKAPDVWIEAVNIFQKRGGDGFFDWYGSGPMIDAMRKKASDASLTKTYFHGFVEDVTSALLSMDVFVLSSRWEGGCLPYSVMEAMFCGTPCILPRLPSIMESLDEKGCAIFYEPDNAASLADAFAVAIAKLETLNDMAATARQYVNQHHSADVQFSQTMHLYRNLLDAG